MRTLWKPTLEVWAIAITKIPLLFAVRPRVTRLDSEGCIVKIALRRKTKNHVGSMYFGALAIGADCAGGLIAFREGGRDVSLIFKDLHAEFGRRADRDVFFVCDDGEKLHALVAAARAGGERVEETVTIDACGDPGDIESTRFAVFRLTISLKRRKN